MRPRLKIWIDLENSPHVLFFEPVIDELRRRGHDVVVTGRRFCNTLALAQARGIAVRAIGRGHDTSRNATLKRAFHRLRSFQLWRFARTQRFDVAASHVSRTQAAAAARLGIPVWAALDYEHVHLRHLQAARCFMAPRVLPPDAFDRAGIPRTIIERYDGLKEDVYLHRFRSNGDVRRRLRLGDDEILVVFRPGSNHAHYGDDVGPMVERHLLQRLAAQAGVCTVVLPRTDHQRRRLRALVNGDRRVRIAAEALDGPALIHAADLVVSGGGTMAREASVLGVPAISCFTGRVGAVDQLLADQGKVRLVRSVDDVECLSPVGRAPAHTGRVNGAPLRQVVEAICRTATPA
jgi:predicted glycosyltransferase